MYVLTGNVGVVELPCTKLTSVCLIFKHGKWMICNASRSFLMSVKRNEGVVPIRTID